jgi:tellurite resistance protein
MTGEVTVRVERIERLANVTLGGEGGAGRRSLIALAAAAYASQPSVDSTTPTGFDPFAVTLFEAIVEAAFLVATADGVFDDDEREVFARIVAASAENALPRSDLNGLVEELADHLAIQGLERRVARIAESVRRPEQKVALLRVAILVALANDTISEPEEAIIERLCSALEVPVAEARQLRLELTELVYAEAPSVPVE